MSWITTSRMLCKIRIAMGHRGSIYRLHQLVEIDDVLIGGQHTGGKRKRGAERKAPILVAVENHGKCAGFRDQSRNGIAICQTISRAQSIRVHSDALPSPAEISKTQNHVSRLTPSNKASEWLPWIHIAIMDNFKTFLLGLITAYRQDIYKSISTNLTAGLTE